MIDILKGSEHEKKLKEPKTKSSLPAAPSFTRKENATLAQWIEILDWHHLHGGKQTAMANHFAPIYPNLKIKQPLVSSWVKDEAKWQAQWEWTKLSSDCMAK
ncbi:hypothetical protein L208DRAFT_1334573 [Tricholoma matsutake]|nr:hypothetical protein L208DRAFT_1334573 [Tricholoma matsutake 945]